MTTTPTNHHLGHAVTITNPDCTLSGTLTRIIQTSPTTAIIHIRDTTGQTIIGTCDINELPQAV